MVVRVKIEADACATLPLSFCLPFSWHLMTYYCTRLQSFLFAQQLMPPDQLVQSASQPMRICSRCVLSQDQTTSTKFEKRSGLAREKRTQPKQKTNVLSGCSSERCFFAYTPAWLGQYQVLQNITCRDSRSQRRREMAATAAASTAARRRSDASSPHTDSRMTCR